MSHLVSIQTRVQDPVAIVAACQRLHLKPPRQDTVELFSGTVTGLAIHLPGWNYPAVFDLTSGQVQYDIYEGKWGEARELDRFLQAYAVEKTRLEARQRGHQVSEQQLADGSIKLQIMTA